MNKGWAFAALVVILLILNLLVGGDILGNFLLGILSAVIAVLARRFRGGNPVSFVGSLVMAIILVPYFAYLVWFAVLGARTLPAEVATEYLVNYTTQNFVLSLPSTIAAGLGAWVVELVD